MRIDLYPIPIEVIHTTFDDTYTTDKLSHNRKRELMEKALDAKQNQEKQ